MSNSSYELTLEQEFQFRLFEQQTQKINLEQAQDLLLQTMRLLMVKDNVIRDLVKDCQLS
ncbi:MAG: photosystem I reaction center subunit XII [Pseudanabaena sp. CRU_2_10]|jgi:Phycobilisome degradation protein nblA|nr:photosystem I reaction center subunit XII [Pseudanabaena sp. CRU_2_10]